MGNPKDLNRYAYVRSNPLRLVDPTGHFSEEEIIDFFDVETWEEVEAFFEEGDLLEGRLISTACGGILTARSMGN